MRSDTVVLPASMCAMMPMLRMLDSFWLRPLRAGEAVALLMTGSVRRLSGASRGGVPRRPGTERPLSARPVREPEWKREIQPEDAVLIKENGLPGASAGHAGRRFPPGRGAGARFEPAGLPLAR